MLSVRKLSLIALIGVVGMSLACNGKEGNSAPATSGKSVYTATGNEGGINGTISFNGAAPVAKQFDTASDAVCKASGQIASEEVIANNGKLQNVFVYVKSGLPDKVSFPPQASEVTLDQKGCRYVPHVLGIHTGASLKIASSDQTNHNIHPMPKNNREWNDTIFPSADPITRKFAKSEVMIPVKCGLHAWMRAYIGVLDHPFFAVSDANGQFTIKGLPPGEYEVEAWHESYKAQTLKVKIEPKADAKADFAFAPTTAYHESTLKLQPALVLP
jgi:hypothetical protein